MPEGFVSNWVAVLVAASVGFLVIGAMFAASFLMAPRRASARKALPYECGIEATPFRWPRTHIRYYVFGLAFLIFDVEAVFLFPWAVVFLKSAPAVFYEMLLFLGMLLFGLFYGWRKGALSWR